jgi:hypothetical protein
LVFASKQAGILPGELCAPANLLSHLTATISLSPQRRRQQQQVVALPAQGSSAAAAAATLPSPAVPAGYNAGSSSLSGFMSQMLEQLRWPQDPWVVGEFPNRRSHSFGSAGMGHVQAAALAAHPTRSLYVSGSSTGRIYLWQFGEAMCKAAYVPITSTQARLLLYSDSFGFVDMACCRHVRSANAEARPLQCVQSYLNGMVATSMCASFGRCKAVYVLITSTQVRLLYCDSVWF